MAYAQGDYAHAVRCHEQSLALWQSAGDRLGIARSLAYLAPATQGEAAASQRESMLREVLAFFREVGDTWYTAYALFLMGTLAFQGEAQRKRRRCPRRRWHCSGGWGIPGARRTP